MNLSIDPAAVEKLVADAIVQSALGEKVKKAVTDAVSRSYDSPIEAAVKVSVHEVARQLVHAEFTDVIRAAVKAKLTPDYLEKLVTNITDKLIQNSY